MTDPVGPWARTACRTKWVLGYLVTAILLSCTPRPAPQVTLSYTDVLAGMTDTGFERVTEPMELVFPKDHGSHPDQQVEWWYLTGYLEDGAGQEYGYQFTLFRYGLARPQGDAMDMLFDHSTLYMGHFAVVDVKHELYLTAEHFARSPTNAHVADTGDAIRLHLDDWRMTIRGDNTMELYARANHEQVDFALTLDLSAGRPPLLHGQAGYSRKGPEHGQASMYYSVIGLETKGQLQIGERNLHVQGTSWFDHEWSTNSLAPGALGWDWFSLQLDNGAAVMFGLVRTPAMAQSGLDTVSGAHTRYYVSPVYVSPAGHMIPLTADEFALTTMGYWTSTRTGVRYPSRWHLVVPDLELECRIEPRLPQQEFVGIGVYWEGLVGARCLYNGVSLQGRGYVELTGYGPYPE